MYRILTYSFNPGPAGSGTIEVPGVYELEDFAQIINVTRNSILYDPEEGPAGAAVSYDGGNTILTLEQQTSYCLNTDKLQIQVLSNTSTDTPPVSVNVINPDTAPIPVNIQGATLSLDADGVEIKNDVGNPVPVNGTVNTLTGLSIPDHDYISMSYTGANLTSVVYKIGGSSGTIVATLTLAYDGTNNLISVAKS